MQHMHININKSNGFSMIEVLISVLVLSIGLLGLAGLQTIGLKNNHHAYMRSQATLLAMEIIEDMRANRNNALAGDYDTSFGTTHTGTTIEQADLATWKNNLDTLLPSGDGAVSVNGTTFTVQIRWLERSDDSSADASPDFKLFTTMTDL